MLVCAGASEDGAALLMHTSLATAIGSAHVLRWLVTAACPAPDRKSTRLTSSHEWSSYAVFCLKKKMQLNLWCGLLKKAPLIRQSVSPAMADCLPPRASIMASTRFSLARCLFFLMIRRPP